MVERHNSLTRNTLCQEARGHSVLHPTYVFCQFCASPDIPVQLSDHLPFSSTFVPIVHKLASRPVVASAKHYLESRGPSTTLRRVGIRNPQDRSSRQTVPHCQLFQTRKGTGLGN